MAASLAWLLALAVRSTIVVAVALGLVALLRRHRLVACHELLTLTAAALLLLPVLPGLLPRWELRLPRLPSSEPGPPVARIQGESSPRVFTTPGAEPARRIVVAETAGVSTRGVGSSPAPRVTSAVYGAAAASLWLAGVLVSLIGLGRALLRERWLWSSSRPLDGPWVEMLAEVGRALGFSRPVDVLECEGIDAPMTGGWRRPAVMLPVAAARWSEERRRVVLQHELVHVLRGDAQRHLLWRVTVALYWWSPLARAAARAASAVGEQACDETVLDLGTRPSAYARHLLEIASLAGVPRRLAHALPMVERSQLERRLRMILDHERVPGRGRVLAAVFAALLVATVAAVGTALPVFSPVRAAEAARAPKVPAPAHAAMASTPAHAPTPAIAARPSVCREGMSGSFSGTLHEGPSGSEWDGTESGNLTLQHNLGDGRRLCAAVKGAARFDERDGSIRELPPGSSVAIETRWRKRSQLMRVTGEAGAPRYEWWIDGASRPVDDAARAWLAHALEVVAGYRAIGEIQGQVGSLQGEIGGVQGEVGGLQGEIGSIQGRVGSLQGKVGEIEGERGSMEGRIGGQEGAIGGLEGRRWQASAAEKASIDKEIAGHRATIEKLRAEMADRQFDRRIAEAQAELQAEEKKAHVEMAALDRRIEDLHADEKIGGLRRKIADLHAEEHIAEIEGRLKPAVERLAADIQRLGS
ncbi:MAG: M56 family metallopeptidase [Verrucomicrobiota bacterium]